MRLRACFAARSAALLLVGLLASQWLCPAAFAGDGRIVPAPANGFGIRGLMNFTINYRYVPTPDDLQRLRTAIDGANDILCDATDGQIVFGTVTITAGNVNEDRADVWILPQGGRSGVSFYPDGSGFGRLGVHINLLQDGVSGPVLAHELGHLAFGLGDEYDEQCRFGGACGIGQAFDAAMTPQNNTVMQDENQSELTVAANHDLLRGNATVCPTPSGCPGDTTRCQDGVSCTAFNNTTGRYESTQHTLMHGGNSEWQILANNYAALGLAVPALPVAAQPGNCRAFLTVNPTVNATNLVCLVMDRSGSMRVEDAGDTTRLEFAKAAARAFVDVSLGLGDDFQLGLVSFNQAATVDQPVQLLTPAYATTVKTAINNLVADGNTAIGDGLFTGALELFRVMGANPTLFLLSDGQNNAGTNPVDVTNLLQARGVRTYTIPTGNGADRPLLSDIASITGGRMLDAPTSDDLPPVYVELAAIHGGHGLVLPRTEFAVKGDEIIIGRTAQDLPEGQDYTVSVETNARSLIVFLSNRNPNVRTWFPTFTISGPGGEVVTPANQPFIGIDQYYQIIRVPNPAPGSWKIRVESAASSDTYGHILSFVENPAPDLLVDAYPKVVSPADTVTISAVAAYVSTLDSAVQYAGTVKQPDGTVVPLAFTRDPLTRQVSASFSSYNGRGIYQATVRAVVPTTARVLAGEIIFDGPADPGIIVQPFERVATAAFFLNSPNFPPDDSGDADGDGILDEKEEQYPPDVDNDGIPNPRDEDSDGDDIPDSEEQLNDLDQDNIPDFVDPKNPPACGDQAGIQIRQDSVAAPGCARTNGLIRITPTGGTGNFTYRWSHDPNLNGPVAAGLGDGLYSVQVTDDKGCTASAVFNLAADCTEKVVVGNNCTAAVVEGCKWRFRLKADVTRSAAPNDRLGSFTGKLTWDPAQLTPAGSPALLNGYNGFFNLDEAVGTLHFNGINANGLAGIVDILTADFTVKATAGTKISLKVEFSVMAAAHTFADLRPNLLVEICEPTVLRGGLLGDVNEDGAVNSTDGLIVLSYDAGKPVSPAVQGRITRGFGDVNADRATNSVDALIILSYELGFPVPYPVGKTFCPVDGAGAHRIAKGSQGSGEVKVAAIGTGHPDDESLIDVPIVVDMARAGQALGSFTAAIGWNPKKLELVRFDGGQSLGFGQPVVNNSLVASGRLTVAGANPTGSRGAVNVFNLRFRKLGTLDQNDFTVDFRSLAAARTFAELTPSAQTHVSLREQDLENELTVAPNPFAGTTTVQYQLKASARVEISVYNALGVKVATLLKGEARAGRHSFTWHTGGGLSPGMYTLKLRTGTFGRERKVVVVK